MRCLRRPWLPASAVGSELLAPLVSRESSGGERSGLAAGGQAHTSAHRLLSHMYYTSALTNAHIKQTITEAKLSFNICYNTPGIKTYRPLKLDALNSLQTCLHIFPMTFLFLQPTNTPPPPTSEINKPECGSL